MRHPPPCRYSDEIGDPSPLADYCTCPKASSLNLGGGLKKIGEISDMKPCRHPQHNPPMHIVLESGIYEYTCPQCGQKTRFNVMRPSW